MKLGEAFRRTIDALGLDIFDYRVPRYSATLPYVLGGISLAGFIILALGGMYIAMFYTPSSAHASVENIITGVPFGDFVRSAHYWAANLIVLTISLHIARTFLYGSYKQPRQLTWLAGVGLLATAISMIFLGSVLKWDQEGIEAFGHMQESAELLGLQIPTSIFGVSILNILFVFHTVILPVLFLAFLSVHVLLIKKYGISPQPTPTAKTGITSGKGDSSFLSHLRKLSGYGFLFAAVVGALSLVFTAPLGNEGVSGAEVTKPLWVFYPLYALEDFFGLPSILIGMTLFFIALALVPFVDRNPYLSWKMRKFIITLGIIVMVTIVSLGVYAYVTKPKAHLEMAMGEVEMNVTAGPMSLPRTYTQQETPLIVPILAILLIVGLLLLKKPV